SGRELPWLTQIVVEMSHFVRDFWWIIIGGIVATVFGVLNFYKSPEGKKKMDTWFIALPIFGPLIQKGAIARFSRTLSTLLSSGVGIIEALDISAKVSGNSTIENSLYLAKDSISEGKSITTPLVQNKYMPDMVIQMIGVGEQTGAMDVMLEKVADFYEDEVDYAVGALTSVMEPLLMVVLGGIIAFLVIAMYLPIFDLASGFG
ncbi:MAG: type II secretion system F family protein, partial [Bdellovibrionales bacterium]|nr:type II secretion system F family protein [Bdellovibrionales bacterium]